jgi:hypothetical protein
MFCAASDPVIERQPCGLAGLVISDRPLPVPLAAAGLTGGLPRARAADHRRDDRLSERPGRFATAIATGRAGDDLAKHQ